MQLSKYIPFLADYFPNQYVRAITVLIVLILIIRIILTGIQWFVMKITSKTKTDLDDILANRTSKPLTLMAILFAFQLTLAELTLSETLVPILIKIIYSVLVIVLAYIVYVIIEVIVVRSWLIFSKKANIGVGESLSNIIHTSLKVIVIIFTFLYILDLWGVQIGPLLAGLGIAGLAIALALQPTLSNIFSGISIILDKSVKIGDLVNLDSGASGKIKKIGLRSTKVNTFDNELVIVPNSTLASSMIYNVALPEPKTRVVVPFSVAYGSNIENVKKIIMKEINSLKFFIPNPEPAVRFLEMADSSLNFKAYFYVDTFEHRLDSVDELTTKIYNALNKSGIEIPFPQRDVHLKKD